MESFANVRRFDRHEYLRMAEMGILRPDERVELIEGEVVSLPAHNLPHSHALEKVNRLLVIRFAATHRTRCQLPLTVAEDSEPEPDFSLVTPTHAEECAQRGTHPSCPDLVIEIADTSLSYDRHDKASLYARALIPEYWIVNLRRRCLEVRTDPGPDPELRFGHGYRSLRIVAETDSIAPHFAQGLPVAVAELLP